MTTLNAYNIKWSIITVNGVVTKKAMKALSKIGYASNGSSAVMCHSANEVASKEKENQAIAILTASHKAGQAFTITDKQFGMGSVNYNGVANANDTHHIVLIDGGRVSSFPVTEMQIKSSVKF